ncbi:MAG TPA: hypothetical protein DDW94_07495 [Deltaproteobacteria bacterium]|nr:MAG: hypothetical protein A2Z79_02025 [Deltaproteobacteria bacterium GWA2_55_82]OGQ62606.1 MAG: hypothetical protein A3I81_08840 [Deltaproteobacteria bacterium RIFCSPLOWO2_02_FULL_55_12]OIJ74195.1 MAG: hypothetical protein A2V21_307925 [Deltaproteobacteria bacterium GWC2_55_46]HBG46818.1 hypothetical protein [Deltaproteobacteria bacterium]HCY11173.1 hypothetical protein [Deltaproteobacteria bacterium]
MATKLTFLKSTLLPFLVLLIFIFASPGAQADIFRQEKFTSPKGVYIVVFTEMAHTRYAKEEMLEDVDNVNNILYRVDFIPNGEIEPLVSSTYTDVYGWEKAGRPARIKDIFKNMLWSPEEDYIIMPVEAWASAPDTEASIALALDPALPWDKASVSLDNISWLDALSFIGDYHLDCDYGVAWFNGEEGSVVSLKDSESPIGYELVSVNAKKVTIRTVLDNCRMQELPPRCFTHDLATGSEEPAACPPRTKPKK